MREPGITREEIAFDVALETGFSNRYSRDLVDQVFKCASQGIADDGFLRIRGVGLWKAIHKKRRLARNPKTGKDAWITARRVVTFKAGKAFKRKIKQED